MVAQSHELAGDEDIVLCMWRTIARSDRTNGCLPLPSQVHGHLAVVAVVCPHARPVHHSP
eukprot:59451-Amphidinium_carterae.5